MASIPANNNTGLYGIDGSSVVVDNNISAGNIVATGNLAVGGNAVVIGSVTANSFIGNGAQLTNINAANVTGNITNAVHANFADVANSVSGANVTGTVANATYATSAGSATTATTATTAGTVTTAAQPNITSVGTLSSLTVSGNVTAASFNTANGSISGGNISAGNISASGLISAVGNVTGGNLNTTGQVSASGNIVTTSAFVGGNIFANNATITNATNTGSLTATGNITGALLQTSGATGNITGANYISANYYLGDGGLLSNVVGNYANANVSNYLASGTNTANIITTGNISGQYILGNGAFLTGVAASYGNSNVATLLANFGSNTIVTTGNITGGNFIGSGATLTNIPAANIVGTVAQAAQANYANTANAVAGGNVSGQVANALVAGTVYTAAQPNITSVGTLTSLAVTGNITSSANISGSYILGNGSQLTGLPATYGNADVAAYLPTYTGNLAGGNLDIGNNAHITNNLTVDGTIYGTFAGNISGNLVVPGSNTQVIYNNNGNAGASANFTFDSATNTVDVNGTVNADIITSTGNVSAVGNITGNYLFGNGSQLTGIVSSYGDSNVNTLLASWGSNTLSTTGNVTAGNLSTTGIVYTPQIESSTSLDLNSTNNINLNGNVRVGDNNTDTQIATHGTGDLLITTHQGDTSQGNIRLYDGASGNIDVTTNGTGKINLNGAVYTNDGITAVGNISGSYILGNGSQLTGLPATYNDSNVTTLLASLGSNVISSTANITTTANVSGGNLLTTGLISATGNVTGGNLISGTLTYTPTDGTAGQVLTTYGNGVTYFSTVSGGGGTPGGNTTELQFNNAGSFAGNAAMTFSNTTGNIGFGNLVIGNTGTSGTFYNVITNKNPFLGNTTNQPSNARILMGSGKSGDWSTSVDYQSNSRNARLLVADEFIKSDNGIRSTEIAAIAYANLNGSTTYGGSNVNSRIQGISSDVFVSNGNITTTQPYIARAGNFGLNAGLSANTGNANLSHASGLAAVITTNVGSSIGNAYGIIPITAGNGPTNTQIAIGISLGGNAASSGNAFGIYMADNTNTYGITNGTNARNANRYYFLRNDDNVAQNKLGSLRYYHEYQYTATSSAGALTINKNNAQVQYVDVTENITSITLSNFVVSASDGTNTDYQMDTVTVIFRQDATGHTITMPTGTAYKYAGGTSTIGSTANSVSMVSISAIYNVTSAATEYLITISPEFS